jgi:hypothetical protein
MTPAKSGERMLAEQEKWMQLVRAANGGDD